jgi:hypothetical protein
MWGEAARRRSRVVSGGQALAVGVCVLALLTTGASVAHAAKPITGKLSKRGYTVIALAANGQAKSVVAKRGRFKLRPRAGRVTLHLRAPDGTYAGPIVVRGGGGRQGTKAESSRRKGKRGKGRVIVGVKAGARLGKVKVKPGKGFALASAAARSLDAKRTATARKGIPIGAGNFGRVRVRKLKGRGSDRDRDGIPTALDVDDDGDLVLDDVDKNTARAGSAIKAQKQGDFNAFAGLFLGATATPEAAIVNANAPGLDDQQIQSGLRARGTLQISVPLDSAELNCRGLVYCKAGGKGRRDRFGDPGPLDPSPEPFPECCDPDRDGFGSLGPVPFGPGPGVMLQTRAGADEIAGGDVLLAPGEEGGQPDELTATLNTIFATVPAIKSYVDELGATYIVSYPFAPGTVLPVVDGPDAGSDVSVNLNFWRPQRRSLPEELPPGAGRWIDIGGLQHFAHVPGASTETFCPQSSYTETDPNLTPATGPVGGSTGIVQVPLFDDAASDQAASPANTFSYTLNLSECQAFRGNSFGVGETRSFFFAAAFPLGDPPGPINVAASSYSFQRQP